MPDTETIERVHCFSNGSEHEYFEGNNCSRCMKTWDKEQAFKCELQEAVSLGAISDGLVPASFIPRLGLSREQERYGIKVDVDGTEVNFGFMCREVDPDLERLRTIYRDDMAERERIRRGPLAVRFQERYKRRPWFEKRWGGWAPSPWKHPIRFWVYPIEYKFRTRVASWLNDHTDLCWAELVSWYLNPVEHPFSDLWLDMNPRGCRRHNEPCYCGKFGHEGMGLDHARKIDAAKCAAINNQWLAPFRWLSAKLGFRP